MHNPKATAHALASVGGLLYIVCALWVVLSPTSFLSLMTLWAHSIDVEALPLKTSDFGGLVLGFITFVVVAWLAGYVFARLYNSFAGRGV